MSPTALHRPIRLMALLALLAALAACATTGGRPPYSGGGTVASIQEVTEAGTFATIAGAIGGAALGGVLGANVGGGSGQIAAAAVLSAVTGTLGAAAAGWLGTRTRWQVMVRSDDGIDRAFALDEMPAFRTGAKVRIEAGRLVPAP
jgi:outer membrane lipoprotein SlyB